MSRWIRLYQFIAARNGILQQKGQFYFCQRCLNELQIPRINSHSKSYASNQQNGNNKRSKGDRTSNNFNYTPHVAISLISIGVALLVNDITKKNKALCSVKELKIDDDNGDVLSEKISLTEAIQLAKDFCQRVKDENGSPGLSVAVSINGKEVWSEGFGYADLENRVQCHADTVMRIASISKPITMTVVAKLWEQGQLDLDKPVKHYVPDWPEKTYKGKKVDITTRQLVSHLAGVRHYDKSCGKKKKDKGYNKILSDKEDNETNTDNKRRKDDNIDEKSAEKKKRDDEEKEFYLKKRFHNVTEALNIFKDDELCSMPGTEYLYTTHGWTLISAVVEGAMNKKFSLVMKNLFKALGLENTYLDETNTLIYNRARQYVKNKQGSLINAPFVDLSCKWAGGGFLSTVKDLNTFGNIMLYSYQHNPKSKHQLPEGYLKAKTVDMIWTPNKQTKCDWDPDGYYGMGWAVVTPGGQKHGQCREVYECFSHTGGAVGGTSALIILPKKISSMDDQLDNGSPPQGVVVSIISNLGSCRGLYKTALKIGTLFHNVDYRRLG